MAGNRGSPLSDEFRLLAKAIWKLQEKLGSQGDPARTAASFGARQALGSASSMSKTSKVIEDIIKDKLAGSATTGVSKSYRRFQYYKSQQRSLLKQQVANRQQFIATRNQIVSARASGASFNKRMALLTKLGNIQGKGSGLVRAIHKNRQLQVASLRRAGGMALAKGGLASGGKALAIAALSKFSTVAAVAAKTVEFFEGRVKHSYEAMDKYARFSSGGLRAITTEYVGDLKRNIHISRNLGKEMIGFAKANKELKDAFSPIEIVSQKISFGLSTWWTKQKKWIAEGSHFAISDLNDYIKKKIGYSFLNDLNEFSKKKFGIDFKEKSKINDFGKDKMRAFGQGGNRNILGADGLPILNPWERMAAGMIGGFNGPNIMQGLRQRNLGGRRIGPGQGKGNAPNIFGGANPAPPGGVMPVNPAAPAAGQQPVAVPGGNQQRPKVPRGVVIGQNGYIDFRGDLRINGSPDEMRRAGVPRDAIVTELERRGRDNPGAFNFVGKPPKGQEKPPDKDVEDFFNGPGGGFGFIDPGNPPNGLPPQDNNKPDKNRPPVGRP